MDKMIIIVYGYDGLNSNNANAICLHNILSYINKIYHIDVVTSTERKSEYLEDSECLNVHYVPLNYKGNMKVNLGKWEKRVNNYIQNNIVMNEISKMLTISFPFNIQEIGLKIKKKYPHLDWSVYELDPFTYNKILSNYLINFVHRLVKQVKVFKEADKILLTHELYSQYTSNFFRVFLDKYVDVGIPIMKIYKSQHYDNKKIKSIQSALYIGSFYSNIRNPEYMLDVFLKLLSDRKGLSLNLVGPTNNDIPEKYNEFLDDDIIIHGRVSKEKVEEFILESDFLINVGNKVNNQLPSKVLEYIGTGKPIINFYSIYNDTSNKYLSKYPNALLINQNGSIEENINKITNFMSNCKIDRIPSKVLFSEFSEETIESVAKKIKNGIK